MYVNGESYGLTPEELRTLLGSPDVEPSKPKPKRRRLRVRRAARCAFAVGGTAVVLKAFYMMGAVLGGG